MAEEIVKEHAKSVIDYCNGKSGGDELTALILMDDLMSGYKERTANNPGHYQAVQQEVIKQSKNTKDNVPELTLVDERLQAKDLKAKSTKTLACDAVNYFVDSKKDGAAEPEAAFSRFKKLLSNSDYEDFLKDSNEILKQATNGKYELVTYDSASGDADKIPDSFAVVKENPEVKTNLPAESAVSSSKLLDKMPAMLLYSEAGADLVWRSFHE